MVNNKAASVQLLYDALLAFRGKDIKADARGKHQYASAELSGSLRFVSAEAQEGWVFRRVWSNKWSRVEQFAAAGEKVWMERHSCGTWTALATGAEGQLNLHY